MRNSNNGGTAFPSAESQTHGMSLRDYFAAHAPAMPDEWAAYCRHEEEEHESDKEYVILMIQWRYYYADKMLQQREKK